MSFFSQLEARVREIDSLLCVGLDPHSDDLPAAGAQAARDFCLRLVAATADQAAAFKPNIAFFEVYGPSGIEALQQVIAAIPAGIPVILDAKRGDIASTAQAYARTAFETLGAQAITLSPYLGQDSLAPFLENPECGVFVLCKTSNPGAGDLQDLQVAGDDEPVFVHVARRAQEWNILDNLGLVVGATYPAALRQVRQAAPDLWILSPGVGAQGGDLQAALDAGLRADGLGLLVSVSRAVSRAEDPGKAARDLVAEISRGREQFMLHQPKQSPAASRQGTRLQIADDLLAAECIRFGRFTLKSGTESPIYIDLRRLVSHPSLLAKVAAAYLPVLAKLQFDRLAALPYAALPIGTAIGLKSGTPLVYPRKEVKEYGTRQAVEGLFNRGERVVVIDDLATTGGSKFEAIEVLVKAGLVVEDVVVLVDRQGGAAEALEEAGYHMHAVLTMSEMLNHWEKTGKVASAEIAATRTFLAQGRLA